MADFERDRRMSMWLRDQEAVAKAAAGWPPGTQAQVAYLKGVDAQAQWDAPVIDAARDLLARSACLGDYYADSGQRLDCKLAAELAKSEIALGGQHVWKHRTRSGERIMEIEGLCAVCALKDALIAHLEFA